jgi:hypothetical protein
VLRGAVGDEHGGLAAAPLALVLAERPLEVELVPGGGGGAVCEKERLARRSGARRRCGARALYLLV